MALTLVEAAKLHEGDELRSTIIQIYAESTDLLREMVWTDIKGNSLRYNREEALPGIAFRGVNESYTESTGILNPQSEPLVIAGGELDVDKFILRTMGEDQRSVHEAMKVKALALYWTSRFFKGDSTSQPREFDGLQVRVTGDQLIPAGATSGGDALSLEKFDEAIDAGDGVTHLAMNKTMRRRLTAAARNTAVGGFITYSVDAFGRKITHYNDIPILIIDEDNLGDQILKFDEANPGGGAAASTSIYILSFGENRLTGIQNGFPDVEDLGELESKPAFRTRLEWYNGIAVFHAKSVVRYHGIKNAAVVA